MFRRALTTVLLVPLLTCLASEALVAQIEAEKTEPAQGETATRPPRHLRVWFNHTPDVGASELTLQGPEGELKLEGLHSMGENDLMVRIVGRVPDGDYTAKWKITQKNGETQEGEWTFAVKRGGG